MQIKAKHLNYAYSEHSKSLTAVALDDVSLTINEGEFFGIIGHTGSGKSTFLLHLNGLIKIAEKHGELYIGDYKLHDKKCDFKTLRSKIGMVFQYPEYQLFAETVFDDIAFGIKNFNAGISTDELSEKVRFAMESVGIDYEKYKDRSPFELSGGQKRRVAIAGVIATRPEILVLDEPVAGLDPQGKTEFLELLHSLKEKFVKTIIIVSHDMNVVCEHCTRVAVFSHGQIIKEGTPKEVFSSGILPTEDLADTAFLTLKLKEAGIDIDSDLTRKDFTEKFAKAYSGGKL